MTQHSPTTTPTTSPTVPSSPSIEESQAPSIKINYTLRQEVEENLVQERKPHQGDEGGRQRNSEEEEIESKSSVSEQTTVQLSSRSSSSSNCSSLEALGEEGVKGEEHLNSSTYDVDTGKGKERTLEDKEFPSDTHAKNQVVQPCPQKALDETNASTAVILNPPHLNRNSISKKEDLSPRQPREKKQQQQEQQRIVRPQPRRKLLKSPGTVTEEYREQLIEERHRRQRQCVFPKMTRGDMNEGGYVDQVHHNHRPQQLQQQQAMLNRSTATRAAAPPPAKEGMVVNRPLAANITTTANKNSNHLHHHNTASRDRIPSSSSSYTTVTHSTTNGPLYYDRLVTEEIQELRGLARKFKTQSIKLAELESTHSDLEARLEHQTTERMEMEATLEFQEVQWIERFKVLEKERDQEKSKNKRLLGFVIGKEKEIQRMIQRKYEPKQRPTTRTTNATTSNQQRPNYEWQYQNQPPGSAMNFQSPHDILEANASMHAMREASANRNMLDFFGM